MKTAVFAMSVVGIIGGLCVAEIAAEICKYKEETCAPEGASVLICNDSQTACAIYAKGNAAVFNLSVHGRMLDQGYLTVLDVLRNTPKGRIKTVVFDVTPAAAVIDFDKPVSKLGYAAQYWLLHCIHRKENVRPLDAGSIGVARDCLARQRIRHCWRALRGRIEFRTPLTMEFNPPERVGKAENLDGYWKQLRDKAESCKGLGNLSIDSPFATRVLDRLIAYAKANGVDVLLTTTPWAEDLLNEFKHGELEAFSELMRKYAESRGCGYADFLRMKFDDDCWCDANHLNMKGAKKFTETLMRELKERKLLPADK